LKQKEDKIKIASIDIPSGWDVNEGKKNSNFIPDMNVSLTLPKLGILDFCGFHYLGGRFVPNKMFIEMGLKKPNYINNELIIKL